MDPKSISLSALKTLSDAEIRYILRRRLLVPRIIRSKRDLVDHVEEHASSEIQLEIRAAIDKKLEAELSRKKSTQKRIYVETLIDT